MAGRTVAIVCAGRSIAADERLRKWCIGCARRTRNRHED
jgi:hypothetical protein